jgi:hypothetical protein
MTAIDVMSLIRSSDQVACSALVKLFRAGQDADEQEAGSTLRLNGRGFSGVDADFLSSLARQVIANREKRAAQDPTVYAGDLSPRQIAAWRKVAPKYSRQLVALANNEDPATYRLPKPQPEAPAEELAPAETHIEFARSATLDQQSRIDRALREGPAYVWEEHDPHCWSVTVPSGAVYAVTGTSCSCADFEKRCAEPNGRCKHMAARDLVIAARLEEERRQIRERCAWISDEMLERVFAR